MLFLSLPKSQSQGTCRINGEPAEFRVLQHHLEIRFQGTEAWSRRRILDASQDGDQIQYSCDDGPGSEELSNDVKPDLDSTGDSYFWLAINGASVTASGVPLPVTVTVHPTPELLIGFRSNAEQVAAQRFFLTAPIKAIEKFMEHELANKIKAGELVCIKPDKPKPPTKGRTIWESGPSLEEMVQRWKHELWKTVPGWEELVKREDEKHSRLEMIREQRKIKKKRASKTTGPKKRPPKK